MNVQEKDKIMQTARMVKSVRDSMNIILTEATVDDYDYLLPYSEMLNEVLRNLTMLMTDKEL